MVALIMVLGSLIGANTAFAADLHVETTGADSGVCGPLGDPCATIAQATTNAISGDRVLIGTGTFTQTATINPGAKSIEYEGAGVSDTIVTANNATNFPASGLFSFRSAGTTVALRDLQVTGFPGIGATGSRFGIWIQPNPANPASAINATISNVRFVGLSSPPAGVYENAVYAANNNGSLTIEDSEVTDVMGNSLLLENQRGAATVTGTTITKATSNSSAAIYDMLHQTGANNWDQTGLHSFTNNTISTGAGIAVIGGFTPTNTLIADSFPIGVTISGNEINTGTSSASAITLVNAANDNVGTAGQIDNAQITGNTITAGSNPGIGINLQGGIPGAVISGNNIRNRTVGISLTRRTQGAAPNTTWDHKPDGAVLTANQLVDNTSGLTTDPGVAVTANANGNWWGCNAGPPVGSSPVVDDCDSVSTFDSSAITLDNWVVLRINAVPASALASFGNAAVTAGFDQLNTGAAAPAVFADGTLLPLSANGGSLSPLIPSLSSSIATSTFTSNSGTGRSATAAFDHQSVTHTWDDDTTAPVVTITAPTDGTETSDSSVDVFYTVTDFGGGVTCDLGDGDSVPLAFGDNTITVSCEDLAGNIGTDSVTVTRLDATPPVVTITAPTNGTITASASVTLQYTVTDDTATNCNLADGASVPLAAGSNSIAVVCTDAFGNVGFDSVSVIRDNNPPVVTILSPLDGAITNAASVPLNFSVINDYGSVSCDLVDGAPVPLNNGPNTITVSCTDAAGNVGSDSVNVTRDSDAPVLQITAPANGSTTTAASTTIEFTVTDATAVVCSPQTGDVVPLAFGSNTLVVTCTDAAGNVSTGSVVVARTSTVPPVVKITSPSSGAIISASSVALAFQAASQDGTVSCTPASGTSVPLAVGTNTLTVNCVDSFGNVAAASVTVFRPDALPSCARNVVITSVVRTGSATRIRGTARLRFAGERVSIQYQPTGKRVIAKPRISADGSFSVTVRRPSSPDYTSNKARYRATVGTSTSSWIKLTRRMGASSVRYDGEGRLQIDGSVSLPHPTGQPLRVERSDACGKYRQIGWLPVDSDGNYGGTVPSGGGSETAVFIRLKTAVAKPSDRNYRFNTYSISQPVVIDR